MRSRCIRAGARADENNLRAVWLMARTRNDDDDIVARGAAKSACLRYQRPILRAVDRPASGLRIPLDSVDLDFESTRARARARARARVGEEFEMNFEARDSFLRVYLRE